MPRFKIFVLFALLGLAAAGCAKKITVDSAFLAPEGVPSSELELATFYDTPVALITMKDRGRPGKVDIGTDPASIDSIYFHVDTGVKQIFPVQRFTPGTARGMVMNRTSADGMQVFRTEASGAVRRLFDFAVQPDRRFVDGRSELYAFTDPDPRRAANASYLVRGEIGGMAGAFSPLSNTSRPLATPLAEIHYTAARNGTLDGRVVSPADTLPYFIMRWTPVTGAAKYWIHVYEYETRILGLRERVLIGAPAPLVLNATKDLFIASVPAATTQYRMGDPGASILTFRRADLHMRAEYFVRITALDGQGRLIGMTTGPTIQQTNDLRQIEDIRDFVADFTDPSVVGSTPSVYLLYSRGAVRVSPGEITP